MPVHDPFLPFRLPDSSRSLVAGWALHLKAPPFHGAQPLQSLAPCESGHYAYVQGCGCHFEPRTIRVRSENDSLAMQSQACKQDRREILQADRKSSHTESDAYPDAEPNNVVETRTLAEPL
jgi:hypothetical protein